ncbi:uncharacterized protein LOC127905168 isoform X2 [Populus trichocarpa]|uniref:uncharacterized protein LOC127905168 isoform X2 n=1 Tax=Populus trichocarpa TaxID=3694 RepID=UPI002279B1BB|nr:uncharacterized protein LOC127905168 isoform X2 [Populus trichocarpa]
MIGLDFSKQLAALQTVRGGVSNSEGWEILGIDYSRLLNELDNRYPGVYLSGKEASRPLVVAEVLSSSAFILASSRESGAGGTSISRPLNSLSSRRANYKGLMKDCLCIMCGLFEVSAGISESLEPPDNSAAKLSHNGNTASAFATRADGVRF